MKRVLVMITPVSHSRIEGISRYAREHGWLLTIHDRLAGTPPGSNYDGVLVTLRSDERVAGFVRRMAKDGVPVVDMTIERPRVKLPRVISDHGMIGFLAGEHFKECGFRSAAWFSTGWTNVHALRFAGLSESLGRTPTRWVVAGEAETIRTVKASGKPVAVLAYSEAEAVRLLHLCLSTGLDVPDDVAILSIGDDPLITDNQPVPISCIRQNFPKGGYEAARLLDGLMEGAPPPPEPILIPPDGITVRRSTDTVASDDPLVRRAKLCIRDNLSRPFGAEQVAAALGVSRSLLDKTFAARTGRSLGREILETRLRKARRLLLEGGCNVNETALLTGFGGAAYFIKKFKAAFGTTPLRWCRRVT